jgi:hypothetical protein
MGLDRRGVVIQLYLDGSQLAGIALIVGNSARRFGPCRPADG